MFCRITDMHDKEVINVCDGSRLGCVDDVEVDTCTAQLCAIVVHGRPKAFGLMGHEEDLIIPWKEIEIIGDETILINRPSACGCGNNRREALLRGLFGGRR
ncbi:MAG: YlmC/YmxH family sporulation protein [Clostridia bacterium]|nr:YlmC/YmxH family sporulation protein [Clostridia bacterium]